MRLLKIALILIICVLAWIARGVYDQHFMLEGYYHVVGSSKKDQKIILGFPSGQKVKFELKKQGVFDFKLKETGEGSISVSVNGAMREKVGYVTSMNSMIVLVIGDKEVSFTQIFPSLVKDSY